jgi:hypothetical protein
MRQFHATGVLSLLLFDIATHIAIALSVSLICFFMLHMPLNLKDDVTGWDAGGTTGRLPNAILWHLCTNFTLYLVTKDEKTKHAR